MSESAKRREWQPSGDAPPVSRAASGNEAVRRSGWSVLSGAALEAMTRAGHLGVIVNEHVLSAKETRAHVDVLSRWFDFISLAELPERMTRRWKRPFCLLTFDDGKRSNATEAAPELLRLGVPAAFYVATHAVTTGEPLWFDWWHALVKKLGHVPPGLELAAGKTLPLAELTRRVREGCERAGVVLDPEDADAQPMSWDQARALARAGFVIGSHSVHHPVLTAERFDDAKHEIEESMQTVAREIGRPCDSFAFPNGNYVLSLAEWARQCGATTVLTTDPLWVTRETPPWLLPRVQLFGRHSPARLEAKLAAAATGVVLKNPNGTGRAYIRVRDERRRSAYFAVKRAVDATAAAAGLAATAPLLVAVAGAVRLSSPGPVLFRQSRVGKGGVPFEMLKFRSMRVATSGPAVTSAGDPRITRVGKILRKTKLDELPQLWNVLKGDMSLVGPRPEVERYVARFRQDYERILSVRPGITDYAAVEYRDEEEVLAGPDPEAAYVEKVLPSKIALYHRYLDDMSLATDAKILFSTLAALFR